MADYVVVNGELYHADELKHYGVLGMKWGIRKGRVSVGTQRKVGDSFNLNEKQKMTRQAVKTLNKEHKQTTQYAKIYANVDESKRFVKKAKIIEKRLDDISSNKLQAGKDFVVNTTYSSNILLDAAGLINVRRERRVDFKRGR